MRTTWWGKLGLMLLLTAGCHMANAETEAPKEIHYRVNIQLEKAITFSPGLDMSKLHWESDIPGDPPKVSAYLIVIDQEKYQAGLLDQPVAEPASAPTLEKLGRKERAQLVINGGYFDAQFKPDGLFRLDGDEIAPLTSKPVHSGALAVEDGNLTLITRKEIAEQATIMQSGPFLIDPGGKMGIQASGSATRRTVVAQTTPRANGKPPYIVLIIFKTPVSLKTAATVLLRGQPQSSFTGKLLIDRAINLDGGPSTGMWCAATASWNFEPKTPVRNVLFFKRR